MGKNLLLGHQCIADQNKGLLWLTEAAAIGYAPAQGYLGRELLLGDKLQPDTEKGIRWLKLAGEQGDFQAQKLLAAIFSGLQNEGLRKPQNALYWADKALEIDDEHPDLLMAKAMAYAQLKQASKASDFYEEALDEAEDREWSLDFYKRLAAQNNVSF